MLYGIASEFTAACTRLATAPPPLVWRLTSPLVPLVAVVTYSTQPSVVLTASSLPTQRPFIGGSGLALKTSIWTLVAAADPALRASYSKHLRQSSPSNYFRHNSTNLVRSATSTKYYHLETAEPGHPSQARRIRAIQARIQHNINRGPQRISSTLIASLAGDFDLTIAYCPSAPTRPIPLSLTRIWLRTYRLAVPTSYWVLQLRSILQ